jgi:hypothetical protein
MTTETTQPVTEATEAEAQETQPGTTEPEVTEVTDGTEDEGFEPDADDEDAEDAGSEDESGEDDDEDDDGAGDDDDDEDGEDSEEEAVTVIEDAETTEAAAEGDAEIVDAEIAEVTEPESEDAEPGDEPGEAAEDDGEDEGSEDAGSEAAAKDEGPALLRILPLPKGGMSPRELLEVAGVVFTMIRVASHGPDKDMGARRHVPAAVVPEGWELNSEHELRHRANSAHCGTWRITDIFRMGDDGSITEQHVPAGPDPEGRGGRYAKDLVIDGPVSIDDRIRVNRLMDAPYEVGQGALERTLSESIKLRKEAVAKAKADKKAADEAASKAKAVTDEALVIQTAVARWNKDAQGTPEMGVLPGGSKDELVAFLLEGNTYLGRREGSGELYCPFIEDVDEGSAAEAETAAVPAEATVVADSLSDTAARQRDSAAPAGQHGSGHGGKNRNRNRGGRQPLKAGSDGPGRA